jgi:hypothetical protein
VDAVAVRRVFVGRSGEDLPTGHGGERGFKKSLLTLMIKVCHTFNCEVYHVTQAKTQPAPVAPPPWRSGRSCLEVGD